MFEPLEKRPVEWDIYPQLKALTPPDRHYVAGVKHAECRQMVGSASDKEHRRCAGDISAGQVVKWGYRECKEDNWKGFLYCLKSVYIRW